MWKFHIFFTKFWHFKFRLKIWSNAKCLANKKSPRKMRNFCDMVSHFPLIHTNRIKAIMGDSTKKETTILIMTGKNKVVHMDKKAQRHKRHVYKDAKETCTRHLRHVYKDTEYTCWKNKRHVYKDTKYTGSKTKRNL